MRRLCFRCAQGHGKAQSLHPQQIRCSALVLHRFKSSAAFNLTKLVIVSLLIIEQRCSFSVFVSHSRLTETPASFTQQVGIGNQRRQHKQNAHDNKCKDPLEGDGFCEELAESKGCKCVSANG